MAFPTLRPDAARIPRAGPPPAQDLAPRERRHLASLLRASADRIVSRWYDSQFEPTRLTRYAVPGALGQSRMVMTRSFLHPLVGLLAGYIGTGEGAYRDVYQDERLRYAPHQADPAVRSAFFHEVLPADEAAVLEALRADEHLRSVVGTILAEVHAPLRQPTAGDPVRLLAVGDCLLNELRVFLPARCREAGISLDMRCVYFSALVGQRLSTEAVTAFLSEFPADLVALSFLTYQGLPPYAALLRESDRLSPLELRDRVTALTDVIHAFLAGLREATDAPFLLHNASGMPLDRWRRHLRLLPPLSRGRRRLVAAVNEAISALVASTPNTFLIDEYGVVRQRGYRASAEPVVPRTMVHDAFFHTARLGDFLAAPYAEVVQSFRDLHRAKVLLVDFDNTLWHGVMADGAVRHRVQEQRLLRALKDAGMLLVAVSKNDLANIRWEEMGLAPSDFVLLKINWNLKVQSIAEAAQELDLGLDSFVLIDDSPAERALVRRELPAVRALDATDAATWRSLERLLGFPNTGQTEEARARTALYRSQAERREARLNTVDYPAMMDSLRLVARFGRAVARDLDRIAELVQRTNQFNTTTIRYSKPELQQLLVSPAHAIYVSDLEDKFGKLGLVVVTIVARVDDTAIVEGFVMSCRAMGFGLEHLVLRLVLDGEREAHRFVGRFVPTDRNAPARSLFQDAGFVQVSDTEWELPSTAARLDLPTWIAVSNRG
jgi:FkbH-like protein